MITISVICKYYKTFNQLQPKACWNFIFFKPPVFDLCRRRSKGCSMLKGNGWALPQLWILVFVSHEFLNRYHRNGLPTHGSQPKWLNRSWIDEKDFCLNQSWFDAKNFLFCMHYCILFHCLIHGILMPMTLIGFFNPSSI